MMMISHFYCSLFATLWRCHRPKTLRRCTPIVHVTHVVHRVRPNHFIAQNNDTEWRYVDIDFANGFAISERCMQTKCIWSVFDCRHNSISHPKKGEIWAISESEWCASAGESSSLLLLLLSLLLTLYLHTDSHTRHSHMNIYSSARQDHQSSDL